MPRCSVCDSPAKATIDRALVVGDVSITALAKRHDLSRQALYRHQDHLPKELVDRHAAGRGDRGEARIAEIEDLLDQVQGLLKASTDKGDNRGALTAVREAGRLLAMVAKLRGDIAPPTVTQVDLVATPEFQTVRARVIAALEAFPDARAAVVTALARPT